MSRNFLALLIVGWTLAFCGIGSAESGAFYYVANTTPPDDFLALRPFPSADGPRKMAMANGTKLEVLFRRPDGWWYVRVWPTKEEGWARSGTSTKAWILCCTDGGGGPTTAQPPARGVSDFTCDQLWFGRNSIFKEAGYCFKESRAINVFGNAGCRYDDLSLVKLSVTNEAFANAIADAERAKSCPR